MHSLLAKKSTMVSIALVSSALGTFLAYAGLSGDTFGTRLVWDWTTWWSGGMTREARVQVPACDFSRIAIAFTSFDSSLIQEQSGNYGRTFSLGPLDNGSGCTLYGVKVTASISSIGGYGSHSEGDVYPGASRGAFNLAVSIPALTPYGRGRVSVNVSGCTYNTLGGSVACPAGHEFSHDVGTSPEVSWRPLPPTCSRQGCTSAQWLCYDPQTNGSTSCSEYNIPPTAEQTCLTCNPPPTVCSQPAQACQFGIAANPDNGLSCLSDTGIAATCQCTGEQRWDSAQRKCRTPLCPREKVCSQLPTAGQEFRTQTNTVPPNAESAGENCASDFFASSCTDSYRWKCLPGHSFMTTTLGSMCHCDNLNLRNPATGACNVAPSVCGNGIKEAGEDCDDWNVESHDDCPNTCRPARCGDGIVWNKGRGTEQCDDGNSVNTDGCTNACENARCGDGFIQGTEQCDDGNDRPGDGCTAACRTEPKGCNASHQCAYIANGTGASTCSTDTDCVRCGNGKIDGNEECDGSAGITSSDQKCGAPGTAGECKKFYGRCTGGNVANASMCSWIQGPPQSLPDVKVCSADNCCSGTNRPNGCDCGGVGTNCASRFCTANGTCAPSSCPLTDKPDGCGCDQDDDCQSEICVLGGPNGGVCGRPQGSASPSPGGDTCGGEPRPSPNPCFTALGYLLTCADGTWICERRE